MTQLTGRMATRGNPNHIPTLVDGVVNNRAVAMKLVTDGSITYLAISDPGASQSDPVWQCRKLDEGNGLVITWADGNDAFDNLALNLASLTYS